MKSIKYRIYFKILETRATFLFTHVQVVIMLLLGLLAKTVMEKSWKFSRLLFVKTKTKTFASRPRPRLLSQDQDQDQDFIFVLELPRDQDFGLEDYITEVYCNKLLVCMKCCVWTAGSQIWVKHLIIVDIIFLLCDGEVMLKWSDLWILVVCL